jgi:hypothetical protein
MRFACGLFTVFALFMTAVSCNSSGPNYIFEGPAAYTTVSGTVCKNGRSSYTAFVVDNTVKYGARIRKISGCEKKIDQGLKDKRDKKRAIYVGGTAASIDKIVVNGEAVVAVASSGRVIADHWKDNKKEELHLADHKGRIVFRKFDNGMGHDKDFNRSFLLDFYPEIVKSYTDEGFFFSGSDFAAYYLGFVDIEGNGSWKEIDFPVAEIAVIGRQVYLFDDLTGTVYKTGTDLEPEEVAVLDDYKEGRMVRLYGGKLAFFKDNKLEIFDADLNSLNTLETPNGFDISAVNVFPYSSGYKYRKFAGEVLSEKIQVFKKGLSDEEKDALSEANIAVSSSWETVDAESGDIIWIGMKNGYVRAYDFAASSWLVEPFDAKAASTYELEMRPYLAASHSLFPKNSETTYENAPFVDKIEVVRGLPSPVTYRFIYEGLDDEGSFTKGAYTVVREALGETTFVGNATELGSGDSEDAVSFEDDFVSVAIRRSDDNFETEPETSFYFTLGQGIPFVGFASADIMTDIESPAPMRFFGFSALTRRFVEYNMLKDEVEKVYK